MNLEALADDRDGLTGRLARVLGGDLDAAQDVRQEALLRAWRRMPPELEVPAQRAWLARTARNLAIDELRRRSRRATLPLELLDGFIAAPGGIDDLGGLREALSIITAHERFVLLLRFEAGLQHAEIASLLDISEEAARKRVARARAAFVDAYRRTRVGLRPLVLLLARGEETPPYVRWLEQAGAEVQVATKVTERELALSQGLVFTGAFDDLHPALYGERPRSVLRGRQDLELDRLDFGIVARAVALELPIVGVCRGHQLLNLVSGGSLYQDVVSDGATRKEHNAGVHSVRTDSASQTRKLLGREAKVHSEHHQAVRTLGRKLRVAARSPDGIVETIERTDREFALGLQWHPEREARGGAGQRVAEALLDAARRRAA